MAISTLMLLPNADHPADQDIANMYLNNRDQFDQTAREWTMKHAIMRKTAPNNRY